MAHTMSVRNKDHRIQVIRNDGWSGLAKISVSRTSDGIAISEVVIDGKLLLAFAGAIIHQELMDLFQRLEGDKEWLEVQDSGFPSVRTGWSQVLKIVEPRIDKFFGRLEEEGTVEEPKPPPKLTWRDVFDSEKKRYSHNHNASDAARDAGYRYYAWNGNVYAIDDGGLKKPIVAVTELGG